MRRRGLEPPPGYPGPGLNLVTRVSDPSIARQIVRCVRDPGRFGCIGRSGCCHGCCHGPVVADRSWPPLTGRRDGARIGLESLAMDGRHAVPQQTLVGAQPVTAVRGTLGGVVELPRATRRTRADRCSRRLSRSSQPREVAASRRVPAIASGPRVPGSCTPARRTWIVSSSSPPSSRLARMATALARSSN